MLMARLPWIKSAARLLKLTDVELAKLAGFKRNCRASIGKFCEREPTLVGRASTIVQSNCVGGTRQLATPVRCLFSDQSRRNSPFNHVPRMCTPSQKDTLLS
jgi:hypothetical protein